MFLKLQSKNYKFIIAKDKVIQSQKVDIVYFTFYSRKITLFNIVYSTKCNFHLILLG